MKKNTFPFSADGACGAGSIVSGDFFRITVLTDRMLRLEYAPDGVFEDRPTILAINRNFPIPDFQIVNEEYGLELHTQHLSLYYDKKEFSSGGLSVKVRSRSHGIYSTWHYGDSLDENLGGTARTLDQVDGTTPLEPGLNSRLQGFSILDDSDTLIISEDGWLIPQSSSGKDIYFFGYGLDYQECLNDFFHLSGKVPLLPRWVLGNWWSRFYPYSDESYMALMDRFAEEEIPLSMAVLDMDWHVTEVPPEIGKGWTGFTWNQELFPAPHEFLKELHCRGLKTAMNLHPAEGIQPHEQRYIQACEAMGKKPELRQAIPFDFNNPDFVKTYFEVMLHPLEQDGNDLWWIDWQQGDKLRFKGADPLWLLNYYHLWNHARNGKRPIIFSRYAGPGSHRYPIGFSGDSIISWASLKFQPYFTATAANIGYGWWSHDIGGHCAGVRDEELFVRWLQFGVFSPILRLHSTSNLFNGKEPWKYAQPAEAILKNFLILRHQLIPYIYTMNWKCHFENLLLARPMYFAYPENNESYEISNQYLFGSEFIVCPITEPEDKTLKLARTVVWLPEKTDYYDFFTGIRYHGGKNMAVYRPMEQIPVFVKAGSIIPLTEKREAVRNGAVLPKHLELIVFAGSDGAFQLYEDSGEGQEYREGESFTTDFQFVWSAKEGTMLTIKPKGHKFSELPEKRQYCITLAGVMDSNDISVYSGQEVIEKSYDETKNRLLLKIALSPVGEMIQICFHKGLSLVENPAEQEIFKRLDSMMIEYEQKEKIFYNICKKAKVTDIAEELLAINLPQHVTEAIFEILFA